MLRIDETSKTLLAPQEGGFVAEAPPARDELLHLLAAGWQAFSAEIDQKHVAYVAHTMDPGVDLLAIDRSGGRIVVVLVGESGRELLGRAMLAGAVVAGWTAEELAASHKELSAAVPGESPRIILVATEWDDPTIAAVEWLEAKHNLELKAFKVGSMRFGSEKLLTVDAAASSAAAPAGSGGEADPAAQFFAHVAQQQAAPEAGAPADAEAGSTPPPVPAA
jgi:hypothetical protein